MWGSVMLLVWGFFYNNIHLDNCFWKIQVVLRRTHKFISIGPEKDPL